MICLPLEVPSVGFCVVFSDCYCLVLVDVDFAVCYGEEEVAVAYFCQDVVLEGHAEAFALKSNVVLSVHP